MTPAIACSRHAASGALGPCARCGTFVCGECGELFESLVACRGCVRRLGLPLTLTGQVVVSLIFAMPTLAFLSWKVHAPGGVRAVLAGIPAVGLALIIHEVMRRRYRGTSHLADVLLTAASTMALLELLAAAAMFLG